jgi:hypothetical protein
MLWQRLKGVDEVMKALGQMGQMGQMGLKSKYCGGIGKADCGILRGAKTQSPRRVHQKRR